MESKIAIPNRLVEVVTKKGDKIKYASHYAVWWPNGDLTIHPTCNPGRTTSKFKKGKWESYITFDEWEFIDHNVSISGGGITL